MHCELRADKKYPRNVEQSARTDRIRRMLGTWDAREWVQLPANIRILVRLEAP